MDRDSDIEYKDIREGAERQLKRSLEQAIARGDEDEIKKLESELNRLWGEG